MQRLSPFRAIPLQLAGLPLKLGLPNPNPVHCDINNPKLLSQPSITENIGYCNGSCGSMKPNIQKSNSIWTQLLNSPFPNYIPSKNLLLTGIPKSCNDTINLENTRFEEVKPQENGLRKSSSAPLNMLIPVLFKKE